MNKKSTQILAVVFTLTIVFATAVMYFTYFECRETDALLISVIFTLLSVLMCLFTVLDVCIGKREYFFKKDTIIVGRKSKTLEIISKADILSPVLITDFHDGTPKFFVFTYNAKKYRILVDHDKCDTLKRTLNGIKIETKDNMLEYFLLYILEIFCI